MNYTTSKQRNAESRELAEREYSRNRRALIVAFVLALIAWALVMFAVPLVGGYCLALWVSGAVFVAAAWMGMHG